VPIPISRARAQELAPRLDEALHLVRNEFEGRDRHRQYYNAFSRLLKPDPLGRVLMMGTDQRDLFVPELRGVISACVPDEGRIFDFGAGDGQTFALVAASVPRGTRVSIEEPNPDYLAEYVALLETQPHLWPGAALAAGFDEIDAVAARSGVQLPEDGSIDLALAIHMVYFLADLPAGLTRMLRFLKPGGTLFAVVADEEHGYTGRVLDRFIERGGETGDTARDLSAIGERRRLLGAPARGGGGIRDAAAAAGMAVELEVRRQPSRLYGHSLADVLALAGITALAGVESMTKFEAAAELLRHDPESVDLRIEDEGPRKGTWSVSQPQSIAIVRRRS